MGNPGYGPVIPPSILQTCIKASKVLPIRRRSCLGLMSLIYYRPPGHYQTDCRAAAAVAAAAPAADAVAAAHKVAQDGGGGLPQVP